MGPAEEYPPGRVDPPAWLSRQMVEPTVLVTPRIRAPRALQYLQTSEIDQYYNSNLKYRHLRAPRVSAVSPDWEMKKQTSSLKMGVFRSRKSEARSTMTGSSVSSSSSCREAMAEW